MKLQQELLVFISCFNWVLFFIFILGSYFFCSYNFTLGVLFGGGISIGNFYVLSITLKKIFKNTKLLNITTFTFLIKYYFKYIIIGFIIFFLIQYKIVLPLGLLLGLSIVVISILLAALIGIKKIFFKEAI